MNELAANAALGEPVSDPSINPQMLDRQTVNRYPVPFIVWTFIRNICVLTYSACTRTRTRTHKQRDFGAQSARRKRRRVVAAGAGAGGRGAAALRVLRAALPRVHSRLSSGASTSVLLSLLRVISCARIILIYSILFCFVLLNSKHSPVQYSTAQYSTRYGTRTVLYVDSC